MDPATSTIAAIATIRTLKLETFHFMAHFAATASRTLLPHISHISNPLTGRSRCWVGAIESKSCEDK
jgi:hypothetical protein